MKKIRNIIRDPVYYLLSFFYLFKKILSQLKILKIKRIDLLIIDDIYPHPISTFRNIEFDYYLKNLKNILILSSGANLKNALNEKRGIKKLIWKYKRREFLKGRIAQFNPHLKFSAKLAYTIFLHSCYYALEFIEKHKIPFIFTLYPGGSLMLNNSESDNRLTLVFQSEFFRKVIVTQKITYEYLLSKNFCKKEDILFIYGCVIPEIVTPSFAKNIDFLNICFVANKYSVNGLDKGFDIYMEVAKYYSFYKKITFNIVGPWNLNDSLCDVGDNIVFHGMLEKNDLHKLYKSMHIIISPNRNNILGNGAFDGFPSAACIEASLHEVLIIGSDPLELNTYYTDKQDIFIVNPDSEEIIKLIKSIINNEYDIVRISENGKKLTEMLFSYNTQLLPRLNLLKSHII